MKFLRKVNAEMKKVVWPSRNKTIFFSFMVILVSVFVAYYLGAFDFIFQKYGLSSLIN